MMDPTSISSLRQRMIEDMTARGLSRQTQRGHILACKRFAAYLKRSPDTATAEDVRLFQLQLMENGLSIQNRNRTMTGVRFLLRAMPGAITGPTPKQIGSPSGKPTSIPRARQAPILR